MPILSAVPILKPPTLLLASLCADPPALRRATAITVTTNTTGWQHPEPEPRPVLQPAHHGAVPDLAADHLPGRGHTHHTWRRRQRVYPGQGRVPQQPAATTVDGGAAGGCRGHDALMMAECCVCRRCGWGVGYATTYVFCVQDLRLYAARAACNTAAASDAGAARGPSVACCSLLSNCPVTWTV